MQGEVRKREGAGKGLKGGGWVFPGLGPLVYGPVGSSGGFRWVLRALPVRKLPRECFGGGSGAL